MVTKAGEWGGEVVAAPTSRGQMRAAVRLCPTCREEFSDRFGFCPLDGARLGPVRDRQVASPLYSAPAKMVTGGIPGTGMSRPAAEYRPTTLENKNLLLRLAGQAHDAVLGLRGAEHSRGGFLHLEQTPPAKGRVGGATRRGDGRGEFRLTVIEQKGLLRRLLAALFEAARAPFRTKPTAGQSPSGGCAGEAGVTALGPAGRRTEELRFAMLEGPGLLSRLTGELGAVAQDSRLTWPEFRRDPAGFARRGVDALDKLGLIPFSRRYRSTP